MAGTDVLIAQYQTELEERETFINQILDQAAGRDLNEHEAELVAGATSRMAVLNKLVDPLRETAKISMESRSRMAEIQRDLAIARNPESVRTQPVEYRSAGEYIVDWWRAGVGHEDARDRMALYHRAAAHQTTADNLGIIPNPVVGSVLNWIDTARPIVSTIGVLPVPGGRFTRPRVTQHTQVGLQPAEKGELLSRKMLIDSLPVNMSTYGGYVNVSRQNIDWSVPSIMDLVVNDLAGQYAIETEEATATTLLANDTPTGGGTIDASSDADAVNAALWGAAAQAFTTFAGAGRLVMFVSPDMLAAVGALFVNVNPQNAISTGFTAGTFGSGPIGNISGIPVVMSAALPPGTALVVNTAAVEAYEQRIGALSVTEPSVLGVQVAYAGYFAAVVLDADGVINIGTP